MPSRTPNNPWLKLPRARIWRPCWRLRQRPSWSIRRSRRLTAEAAVADLSAPPAEPVVNPAVAKSLRPQPRPVSLEQVAATSTQSTAAPGPAAPPRVVDPATLKVGTRLVQFGAYDSAEAAEADWTRIATQFGELMAGKGMVVQSATSGGRTFWRLRAEGFEDDADARRFCAALQAENATCIPVVWR
ncbi:MAG: SPOR domain-containing protein [Exiguobacterium profundum]|nr:MAG: SPOR domain-containing protein [Exiguobacterium profundum]